MPKILNFTFILFTFVISFSAEGKKILSSSIKIAVLNPIVGSQDFATRCSQPGVLRCVGFDQASEISGRIGNPTGLASNSGGLPTIDTGTKASGAGSLKFVIPTGSGSDPAGSYFANFSDDNSVQFGAGQEFFVQWRQFISPELVNTVWQASGGGQTSWKQAIVGAGDLPGCTTSNSLSRESYVDGKCAYSCTDIELVVTRQASRKFPVVYNSCNGSSMLPKANPFEEPFGAYDFKLQNAMPAPYCTYHNQADGTSGNCMYYSPNEWMTFQLHVKLGTKVGDEFKNSIVKLYVARQNQESKLVIDWGNTSAGHPAANLVAGNLNEEYGKVWLTPYMTSKDPAQANPMAVTWYDELIVSRYRIADPK